MDVGVGMGLGNVKDEGDLGGGDEVGENQSLGRYKEEGILGKDLSLMIGGEGRAKTEEMVANDWNGKLMG